MSIEKYNLILALLIINKGDSLNNSYKLMRILEWQFKTVDSKKILDEIKEERLAEFDLINGVHFYRLTSFGKELVKREYNEALEYLLKSYPNESDAVTSLFSAFSCD